MQIAPQVPSGAQSGHIVVPDIGIPSGRPSSTISTTRTMTAAFSTLMTVPPVRIERAIGASAPDVRIVPCPASDDLWLTDLRSGSATGCRLARRAGTHDCPKCGMELEPAKA